MKNLSQDNFIVAFVVDFYRPYFLYSVVVHRQWQSMTFRQYGAHKHICTKNILYRCLISGVHSKYWRKILSYSFELIKFTYLRCWTQYELINADTVYKLFQFLMINCASKYRTSMCLFNHRIDRHKHRNWFHSLASLVGAECGELWRKETCCCAVCSSVLHHVLALNTVYFYDLLVPFYFATHSRNRKPLHRRRNVILVCRRTWKEFYESFVCGESVCVRSPLLKPKQKHK